MGDFNVNLLNFESHYTTDDVVNTLSSYLFQPHILQPIRITNYSATLIDNIFLNSLEHSTISDLLDHLPNFLFIKKMKYFLLKPRSLKDLIQKLTNVVC